MFKKISYSFLFFLAVQFVLFSCCEPQSFNVYLQNLDFGLPQEFVIDGGPIANEDLYLELRSNVVYDEVSSVIDTKALLNSAYATSCPDDNFLYLNNFTAVNIIANVDLLGITAGETLNDKLNYFIYNPDESLELSNLLDSENNIGSYEYINFKFIENIPSATTFNLTITVTTAIDTEFSSTTENITIE